MSIDRKLINGLDREQQKLVMINVHTRLQVRQLSPAEVVKACQVELQILRNSATYSCHEIHVQARPTATLLMLWKSTPGSLVYRYQGNTRPRLQPG